MSNKVALNGLGRIGRLVVRSAFGGVSRDGLDPHKQLDMDIVHINDLAEPAVLAHLLEFDSVHGRWQADISADDTSITINGTRIPVSRNSDLAATDWAGSGAQIVLDCTGKFRSEELAQPYFDQGVKKVIISAPVMTDNVLNVVMGVNDDSYDPARHHLLTAASCTTNCLAPVVKIIHENFTIRHGQMTTIHDPTTSNVVIDAPVSDLRRARSALTNIQPTSTGSAKAIAAIYPDLNGKLNGHAVRIPVLNASLTDCVFEVETPTDVNTVNACLSNAAQSGPLAGILGVESRPLVSSDYVNDTRSSIVDLPSTLVTDNTMIKIYAWYDNEVGYANRMLDLARHVFAQGL